MRQEERQGGKKISRTERAMHTELQTRTKGRQAYTHVSKRKQKARHWSKQADRQTKTHTYRPTIARLSRVIPALHRSRYKMPQVR